MFCLRCGAQIDDSSVFCPECGAAVAPAEEKTVAADFDKTVAAPAIYQQPVDPSYGYPQPAPVNKKKSVMPAIIAILAVLLIVAVGAFIFKEDIVDLFEKDSKSSRSDKKGKNESDDESDYEFEEEPTTLSTELGVLAEDTTADTYPADILYPTAATRPTNPYVPATEINTEHASERPTVKVTEPTTQKPASTPQVPQTKEEIVTYFNNAINGVKPNASKVIHKSSAITLNGSCQIPKAIDIAMKVLGGADKFISDQLVKNSKGEQVYTGGDIKAKFPVEGESYASKLTANDVKSVATQWSEDGKYLIVQIVAKSDAKSSNVSHGTGYAPKAFNVVLPGVVNDNVPSAVASLLGGDAEMDYPDCTVIAYINFDTGKVEKAQYVTNWTINFGDNIVLPFRTTDMYEIYY